MGLKCLRSKTGRLYYFIITRRNAAGVSGKRTTRRSQKKVEQVSKESKKISIDVCRSCERCGRLNAEAEYEIHPAETDKKVVCGGCLDDLANDVISRPGRRVADGRLD